MFRHHLWPDYKLDNLRKGVAAVGGSEGDIKCVIVSRIGKVFETTSGIVELNRANGQRIDGDTVSDVIGVERISLDVESVTVLSVVYRLVKDSSDFIYWQAVLNDIMDVDAIIGVDNTVDCGLAYGQRVGRGKADEPVW